MRRLTGKVAVVTGSSRGIGAAIARRLATDGAIVIVNFARDAAAAQAVVSEIESLGGEAEAIQADLTDPIQSHRLIQQAYAGYRKIDILINNAGTAEFSPLEDVDECQIDRIFDLNVRGLLLTTKAASAHMTEGGRVVNISSGAARAGNPNSSVYAGSKAAVEAITACLAAELGPRGITVNTVSPGITSTDLLDQVIPRSVQETLITRTPLGRIGSPDDIADVVAFLASDEARWVTGQVIAASGGLN